MEGLAAELKGALEKAQKLNADLNGVIADQAAYREKNGRESAALHEKQEKMDAHLQAMMDAQEKRWTELERKLNHAEAFGGGKSDPMAVELGRFNAELAAEAVQRGRSKPAPIDREHYARYKEGFEGYLRGSAQYLDANPDMRAAMQVGSDPKGGYLVPADMSGRLVELLRETSPMRQVSDVVSTSRDRLEGIRDLDEAAAGGWVGETASRNDSDEPDLGKYEIPVHEQYAQPKATQQMLDDSMWDIESYLERKVVDKFARQENTAFVTGNGVSRPRGFTTYGHGQPSATTFEVIERLPTGAAGAFAADPDGPDVFIDALGAMKDELLEGSVWLMKRASLTTARKLKDSNGRYQLVEVGPQAGLNGRPGFSILGYPVLRFDDMAAIAANSLSIAFGNFREGYQIVDRTGVRVLRDPFTDKPHVRFYSTKRVGGDVVNFEAIKLIRFAAAAE